jgi:hypothetical protein
MKFFKGLMIAIPIGLILWFLIFWGFLSIARAADPWTKGDLIREGVLIGLKAVDYGQTRSISKDPAYYEINPLIGRDPSTGDVNRYFLASTVGHVLVAHFLPGKWRRIWQYVWITGQAATVGRNYSIGLRIDF